MRYITAEGASEIWKMPVEQVNLLCREGRIPGAVRESGEWLIPAWTRRPSCRKCPFLMMTDLYSVPGSASRVARSLDPRDEARFRAELAYYRGEIDQAHATARLLSVQGDDMDAHIGQGMLLSLVAMHQGDRQLWEEAKQHISEADCCGGETEQRRFYLAAADSAIHDIRKFPPWFQRGSFEHLHRDAHPAAAFFYVKHLLVHCMGMAATHRTGNEQLNAMRAVPAVAEPLISMVQSSGALLAEIYLRLLCAIGYHNCNNDALAERHLDRAIALALPDRLYAPLAEHRKNLHHLMDVRLEKAGPEALLRVRALNKQLLHGWTKLHNSVLERRVSADLTVREHEIASLAVFGLSNREIAEKLKLSVGSVKQSLYRAMEKTGAGSRAQLGEYL